MSFNRADFPMLHNEKLIYLDSAATSLKPSCVIEAMNDFYRHSYGTVHRGVYHLSIQASDKYNEVREKMAHFLHARFSDEIVFTRGTTEGINLIARIYPIQAGDEIVISGQEHHSNIVPWQLLCERVGAYLKVIPLLPNGEWDLKQLNTLITSRTKLVSITHVSNVLGIINPVEEVIAAAHAAGAKVILDAAQSVVHIPLDVQALDCDCLVFSSHKMFGPTGVGVLYGKREFLHELPPYQGGGDMIQTVTFEKTTFQDPPLRFEAGTPMIAEVIGLGAALDYLSSCSRISLLEYETHLVHALIEHLPSEVCILGPLKSRTSLLSFHIPGIHPLDIATFLDLEGIAIRSGHLCAQPLLSHFGLPSALRVSIAPYNTIKEINHFCKVLDNALKLLK